MVLNVYRQSSVLSGHRLLHHVDERSAPVMRLMNLVRDLVKRVGMAARSALVAAALPITQQESVAHEFATAYRHETVDEASFGIESLEKRRGYVGRYVAREPLQLLPRLLHGQCMACAR